LEDDCVGDPAGRRVDDFACCAEFSPPKLAENAAERGSGPGWRLPGRRAPGNVMRADVDNAYLSHAGPGEVQERQQGRAGAVRAVDRYQDASEQYP